jgi:hypothetical protein
MMGEMPDEWINSTVIPVYKKGGKQNVEHYRLINPTNACFWNGQPDPEKADLVSIQISTKLLTELNLETHFAFPDYVKAFDRVNKNKLFKTFQSTNVPNLLLKSIIEIYSGNKIKVRINYQLPEEHTVNCRVTQGCPL